MGATTARVEELAFAPTAPTANTATTAALDNRRTGIDRMITPRLADHPLLPLAHRQEPSAASPSHVSRPLLRCWDDAGLGLDCLRSRVIGHPGRRLRSAPPAGATRERATDLSAFCAARAVRLELDPPPHRRRLSPGRPYRRLPDQLPGHRLRCVHGCTRL